MKRNVINQYLISGTFHLVCDLCSFINVIIYVSVKATFNGINIKLRLNKDLQYTITVIFSPSC